MTTVMAQPSGGLTAPSARQDIISALLSDYGNSFGRGEDASPYDYTPSPAFKELPPPPPPSAPASQTKALPPLMMRFQLRAGESPSPTSPFADTVPSPGPPTRITSRAMSRNSKPTSLKLLKSNGSTALVPTIVPPPAPAKDESYLTQTPVEERPLPPPPPPKSERRQSQRTSKQKPERRDSKEVQDGQKEEAKPRKEVLVASIQPVKRKPVPAKGLSLADLGSGPRGRKPLPQPGDARQQSVPRSENESPVRRPLDSQPTVLVNKIEEPKREPEKSEAPAPAPTAPLPPVPMPRKAIGLPSNPRANSKSQKPLPQPQPESLPEPPSQPQAQPLPVPEPQSQPESQNLSQPQLADIKNVGGKESAGLDSMKSASIYSPELRETNTAPVPSTITPGPTPPPGQTEAIQTGAAIQNPAYAKNIYASLVQSPVSPASSDGDNARPCSFDAAQAEYASLVVQEQLSTPPAPPPKQPSPVASPPAQVTQFPPRTTSRKVVPAMATPPAPARPMEPVRQALPPRKDSLPYTERALPSLEPLRKEILPLTERTRKDSLPSAEPVRKNSLPQTGRKQETESFEPRFPFVYDAENSDPFVPLTKRPVAIPPQPIKAKHLNCYTSHMNFSRYAARFQPPSCMVCHKSEPGFRATCSCCYLQLCGECDRELVKFPGRDLRRLVDERGVRSDERDSKDSTPSVVVSDVDDPSDFS